MKIIDGAGFDLGRRFLHFSLGFSQFIEKLLSNSSRKPDLLKPKRPDESIRLVRIGAILLVEIGHKRNTS